MRSLLMTVLSNNRQLLRLIFGFNHHLVPVPSASFISLTFTPKPVLWYFLDSRKYRPPPTPLLSQQKPPPGTVASAGGERDACVKA